MILVFGGTTEGRMAIKTLDEGKGRYIYSTLSEYQHVECIHGEHIHGARSFSDMLHLCLDNGVRLIVDAAHPFAKNLHATIADVAQELKLPVIRLERIYPDMDDSEIIWCEDFTDAISKMEKAGINKLLALTGVQTIPKLKEFWELHETWFRVLNRRESVEKAVKYDFPESRLILFNQENAADLISELKPDAIITKESGTSGGFEEKVNAAISQNLKAFVVRRPKLPDNFIVVDGRHGLRMEIERVLPDFYPLHTGFTTGSCATAAAKAALLYLVKNQKAENISFKLPEGETIHMDIEKVCKNNSVATASVIKKAGDDPDVTDKSRISVTVSFAEHNGIIIKGGEGVGTVTLPGLGLPIGAPAINPVPKSMIECELSALYSGGLDVTISIEGGDELASKTFNSRVGVQGGVSIIGTTGIVRPFSHEAFLQAIRREMEVALAVGCRRIVVNSGGRSEKYMKTLYRELQPQAFIHYGNAIGETMQIAEELKIPMLTIGLMLGKAVKLADGNMDTHSHKITFNRDFLLRLASENKCSDTALCSISKMNMARELWKGLSEYDSQLFFPAILKLCYAHCTAFYHGDLETVLIDDDGKIRYRI